MEDLADQFKNRTILVIGDLILDEYIFGDITRMSPEAPKTPVILIRDRKYVLGGAANVANNIVSLGGKAILLGELGNDGNGEIFRGLLRKAGIINRTFVSIERPTTIKTRVFYDGRQIARIDAEKTAPLCRAELKQFAVALQSIQRKIDFVVISDYAKGMFSKATREIILERFSGEKILADPKPIHKDLVRHLRLITPNLKETSAMAGVSLKRHDGIRAAIRTLARELDTSILATMGHEGMMLCNKKGLDIHRIPPPRVRAVDVTGAGDVATAACALALASGVSLAGAAHLANLTASISVTKQGTATVTLAELRKSR